MPKTFESKKKTTVSSIVKDNLSKKFVGSTDRLEMGSNYKGINESLQMYCGKAMKNSSLPSHTSYLASNCANSESTSSSLTALKKQQSQKTTSNENSIWLFVKNEKSKKIYNKSDYSNAISRMFSDGLSDSDDSTQELRHFTELPKLGNYSLPSRAKVALSECASDNRTKKENFVPALIERKIERVEKNTSKNKFIENEPGLMPSLTNHKSIFYTSAKINQSEDENLKLCDLFKNIEKNSVTKPAEVDNVRCTSFHLYEPPKESLSTDSEHIGSQLSNISSISLTSIEFDSKSSKNSTTSFEQESQPYTEVKDSSFEITQAMYLRHRKRSLIQKKDKNTMKFSSRICNSVIKEQKSELENRSPVKLNYIYSPEYEDKNFVGEEKHLGNSYLPKQPAILEDIAAFSLTKQHLKRPYVSDQNQNFTDTEVIRACNRSEKNCQASTTINIPQNSFPKIQHLSIDPFPETSDRNSNISDHSTSRFSATDSFSSISKNVQAFVKEWLDNQDKIDATTGNDYLGTNEIPRKRRRHDINSEKWVEKTLSPEKMLSNYSCEYDEVYKVKAFHPN